MGIVSPPSIAANLCHTSLEQEMRRSYVDYAMSVIVSRALPDVRDGQKPVQRRILYAMREGGYTSEKPHRKSARVVGDVMGKYHPHGDASIYDAMVRMAQSWSARLPLIDGQGNFGSPDGDPPAAMRYTEARLSPAGHALLNDLDEGTVPFGQNYDGNFEEPAVLPAEFPALLVNGATGIAVGMATNMAPHNFGEVIDATLALMDNPAISLDELMLILPGPDFPTGGVIHGTRGIRDAYATGSGSIPLAGVHHFETTPTGRVRIIFTELPYRVNKEELLKTIAKLVNDKEIEGISDLRDESEGDVRLVIEIKRDANPDVVLARLQKRTDVTQSFSVNANCLDAHGQPRVMSLIQLLDAFISFRRDCLRARTRHRLEAARDNLGRQVGLFAARSKVDEVIRLIRSSPSPDVARAKLMEMRFKTAGDLAMLLHEVDPDAEPQATFQLSEAQARQVLQLRLTSLTALEGEKIMATARDILANIASLDAILRDPTVLDGLMRTELAVIKARHATPRLTEIRGTALGDINEDDLVEDSPVVLSLTQQGYVKITPLAAYREQARGGKGRSGMETKDADTVTMTLVCSLRTRLLFFTSRGIVHSLKTYKINQSAASGRGRPVINFIRLNQGETVTAILPMVEQDGAEEQFLMFVTDTGEVRRNPVSDFGRVTEKGLVAMKLEDESGRAVARLIAVRPCTEADDLVLATRRGKAIRFPVSDIRVFKGRNAMGNKGITLANGDEVISAAILRHFEADGAEREAYFSEGYTTSWVDDGTGQSRSLTLAPERVAEMQAAEQTLLVVTSQAYGKRFSSLDFRTTDRGGQGVWVGTFSPKTGHLMACFPVEAEDGIMLQTDGGQVIRTRCAEIRVMRRSAQGVTLFDLPKGQQVADVAHIPAEDD